MLFWPPAALPAKRMRARIAGPVGRLDWLPAAIGTLVGIGLTGWICRLWLGDQHGFPYLIAPMGASAVLLFAFPASPLSRPWAVFGGTLVSAIIGIAWGRLVEDPVLAGALAVASAILAMRSARCLHPPGGAVALVAATGGSAIHMAGWSFILFPVALNAGLLVAIAWVVNNMLHHRYPHHVAAPAPASDRPTRADIEAVLGRYDELLDISAEDLDRLIRQIEDEAEVRRARA